MKRALISVYNKAHLDSLVPFLERKGYNIFSTGGTYTHISNIIENKNQLSNINEAFDITEQCDGRVKTLHPGIFSGILDKNEVFFDLVAVNLYPFLEEPDIETIDIGGYSLIRASIKNHKLVTVLTEPEHYIDYIENLERFDKLFINNYYAKRASELLAKDAVAVSKWLNK